MNMVASTLLPHSSDFSAVAMLNVNKTLHHDTQIGIATPCQTDCVSIATVADMMCRCQTVRCRCDWHVD